MALEVTGGVIRDGSGNEATVSDLIDGRAKVWIRAAQGNISSSFNVASVSDNGTGQYAFVLNNVFASNDDLVVVGSGGNKSASNPGVDVSHTCGSNDVGQAGIEFSRTSTQSNKDPGIWCSICDGTLA